MNVKQKIVQAGLLGTFLVGGLGAWAAEPTSWPDFQQVYNLVREHLSGANEEELNRAAVQGFVNELATSVKLVPPGRAKTAAAEPPRLSRTNVFDRSFAYLRVAEVAQGLPEQFQSAIQSLTASNRIKGLALDLRFADGYDYGAAAAVADKFLSVEKPLLNWSDRTVRSTAKSNALTFPVAVLVNRQTVGSSEALAALLRQNQIALLIGSPTSGQAKDFKDYSLQGGWQVQIASGSVHFGDGQPLAGLQPDIQVTASTEDEKAWFADPYKVLASAKPDLGLGSFADESIVIHGGKTNRVLLRPRNEAELVRMQNEGEQLSDEVPLSSGQSKIKPTIQDPALARALDLLKGLAVVGRSR